jgi:manganese/zinc/iron transport system ATP- binding protein
MLAPPPGRGLVWQGMQQAPIAVENLTVTYGGRPALENVDWISPRSGTVAIVGPNGAGKSTLMKAVLGLVRAAAGKARIFGGPVEAMRDRLAYIPQRASVDWDFPANAEDVVAMGLYRRIGWLRPVRRSDREAARRHLDTVGLGDFAKRQIGALSGGQQQRVFLARALAQEADLFLFDEPFAGVDAVTEGVMTRVFHALRDRGALVVCVHHDLGNVAEIFDHVLLLNRRVIAAGTVAEAFTPRNIAAAYGVPLSLELQPRPARA